MSTEPDDIRTHLDAAAEQIRIMQSALSKAQTALGYAMHADSFAKQARYLERTNDDQN